MTGALKGMLFQHQTLKQGVINIAESMASEFIDKAITVPLEKWISAEAEKLAVSIHSATGKTAVENTQRATNAAADAVASAASVLRASGVAGAQGTASFAGAPWPIDMGAPAFGLAMAAASLSYLSVASAEKGWARVPYDNAPAILHKDEMVLPASLAKGVRNMSGAGGGSTVHIHTIDARGVKEFFRRNPGALAQGVKHAQRLGHLSSIT